MRTFVVDNTNLGVRCRITTNDLVIPAYGRNFIDIEINSSSHVKPNTINVVLFDENEEVFTYSVLNNKCHISLDWLKYFAPKSGTRNIYLDLCINNDIEIDKTIKGIEFELTAGHGEVDTRASASKIDWEFDWFPFAEEIAVICPTQKTRHNENAEVLVLKNSAEFWAGEGEINFDLTAFTQKKGSTTPSAKSLNVGVNAVLIRGVDSLSVEMNNQGEGIRQSLGSCNITENTCHDIEFRITNRYGLRGVIGGKIIDVSEGGDDVKSNFNNYTLPYNGIYQHQKTGQKIQKEVGFDCGGDFGLLELLRDACVYGMCEWYDNVTGQWLPCQVVDNSLDTTDAFKEQSITFILQEL